MNEVKIIVERSKDFYTAYADNVDGVYGGGATIEEAKQSALDGICLLKEFNSLDNVPDILKGDYEVVFQLEADSVIHK
jgi:predicted RNase H-like HicB family nuclease